MAMIDIIIVADLFFISIAFLLIQQSHLRQIKAFLHRFSDNKLKNRSYLFANVQTCS